MNTYIPERPIEPPEYKPDCVCNACMGEFYGDEDMYRFDGRLLCGECRREEITMLPIRELAEMVQADRLPAIEVKIY